MRALTDEQLAIVQGFWSDIKLWKEAAHGT